MKTLIKLLAMVLAITTTTAEEAKTNYTLEMTGVTWGGCKTYVRAALQKTFEATSIVITKGDKPKTQKVTFTAGDKSITKREAADAMGPQKRRFVVERLKKAKQEDSKNEEIKRELKKLDKDGKFHLLLLKQTPYVKV